MSNENIPTSTMNVTTGREIVANDASRGLVPGWGGRVSAALVWDGTDEVRVPAAMGVPREDQMQGTARERLVELAGRVSYDSLGKGRDSKSYHEHILQVGHLSVLEHAAFTVEFPNLSSKDVAFAAVNRPSVWVEGKRLTLNLRHVREWERDYKGTSRDINSFVVGSYFGVLAQIARRLAPNIVSYEAVDRDWWHEAKLVEPLCDEEKWVTFYTAASRGCGEEMIRHGDWTAFSRRSTRFVQESESEWVLHPLIAEWLRVEGKGIGDPDRDALAFLTQTAQRTYDDLVNALEPWLVKRGVEKTTARKQARGAARSVLGLGLESETIVSFSVAQARHMLKMRAADAADAEIRLQFAEAFLPGLKASRYADRFADLELQQAKDGIGRSLKGGGAK